MNYCACDNVNKIRHNDFSDIQGSVMACSFLLLNGSKLNAQDEDGMTPLHLATEAGHTGQVYNSIIVVGQEYSYCRSVKYSLII